MSSETTVTLPVGWRDGGGRLHREVTMRAARVRDEILALEDFRVHLRPDSYAPVLLARVVRTVGSQLRVSAGVLERLDPADLRALEAAYRALNAYGPGGEGPAHE
jgi:hypothetical protein